LRQIVVYVPADTGDEGLHIARGSGIVGEPKPSSGTVLIYFEGAIYKPVNISTFADRVMHAYYRMTERAPTIAKDRVPVERLIPVGTLDPIRKQVTLTGPESERDLARWLGAENVEPRQLRASRG
jgi:hypothetical protein